MWEWLANGAEGVSTKLAASSMAGFNSRLNKERRLYVIDNYFEALERVYYKDDGGMYFRHYAAYMRPKSNNIEELVTIRDGYRHLLATTDVKEKKLVSMAQ